MDFGRKHFGTQYNGCWTRVGRIYFMHLKTGVESSLPEKDMLKSSFPFLWSRNRIEMNQFEEWLECGRCLKLKMSWGSMMWCIFFNGNVGWNYSALCLWKVHVKHQIALPFCIVLTSSLPGRTPYGVLVWLYVALAPTGLWTAHPHSFSRTRMWKSPNSLAGKRLRRESTILAIP